MSAKLLPNEVTVSCKDATVIEWDMPLGDPFKEPLAPVMLFIARDIHDALRNGRVIWPRGGELQVTPDGYAHCTAYGHGRAVYELFPARFDDLPYQPAVYVGRWPD